MAGSDAEMTIVVRARDEATKVLKSLGGVIGRVLTSPITLLSGAVRGIYLRFFSLKNLLIGGGIVAVVKRLTDGLSTSNREFKPLFSEETQRRINATDDAFARLGATIQSVFGRGIVELGFDRLLTDFTTFITTHKDDIINTIRTIVGLLRDAASIIKSLANGSATLGNVLGFKGNNAFGIPTFDSEQGARNRRGIIESDDIYRRAMNLSGLPSVTQDVARESYEALLRAFRTEVEKQSGSENGSIIGTIMATDRVGNIERIGRDLARMTQSWTNSAPAIERVAKAMADAFAIGGEGAAIHEGIRAAADEAERFNDLNKKSESIIAEVIPQFENQAKAVEHVAQEQERLNDVIKDYLSVAEFADNVAGNITDSFIDIIKGTKSVGQAFSQMVSKILEELGRLLIYRSLLRIITSAFGGVSSVVGSGGGGFTSESGYGGATSTAFASGGQTRGSGIVRVGENGPEDVALPGGSRVSPSQRSRDGGGFNVTVYGARDAKATALEVAAEIRRNARLRRAFA